MAKINGIVSQHAREYCKGESILSGWTQDQHIRFQAGLILDGLGAELTVEDRTHLLLVLSETVNPSAFRQKLEDEGILTKVEKGETKKVDLANRFAEFLKPNS